MDPACPVGRSGGATIGRGCVGVSGLPPARCAARSCRSALIRLVFEGSAGAGEVDPDDCVGTDCGWSSMENKLFILMILPMWL